MQMRNQKILTNAVAIAVTAILSQMASAQEATDTQNSRTQTPGAYFDLPAQNLADSLRAVSRQTDINILINQTLIGERQAPALRAQLTVGEALGRLLEGTGLVPRFIDDK